MKELDLQDKYIINFFCERQDGLHYKEAKANTVSPEFFLIEDLHKFISETQLNKESYRKLLKRFNTEQDLLKAFVKFLDERVKASANMALFINNNKTITFEGVTLNLFYPSGSETYGDKLFDENIFTVVQELPYTFKYEGKQIFAFRPDLSFFLNGIYLGYSELKSNWNNQNAKQNGRFKVGKDYLSASREYITIADGNDISQTIRKNFLKIFEKAIHITSTDISETYVIRNIKELFEDIKSDLEKDDYESKEYYKKLDKNFKIYPVRDAKATRIKKFEEILSALYSKKMIEKEILYYNFLERELVKKEKGSSKEYKHNDGRLISPRPKQKFGTDKIIDKIEEFLEHEQESDYFLKKLEKELRDKKVGEEQIKELIAKRQKYQNNKNVYSLLLQYSAGFGKSNIIGWTASQLKDLRNEEGYVYDKIMIVVDRLQLRDQLDTVLHNMNIQKGMFVEAKNKESFIKALSSDKRIIVVNIQKFGSINQILDKDSMKKLSNLRVVFLIDEIHRSNDGFQNKAMLSVFDELQGSFDGDNEYNQNKKKKNLIVGFTATPSDHTLARFGEFSHYAENMAIWMPFDSYTMKEAIEDGYILNPIRGVVPVSAKMYFEIPDNPLEGFEDSKAYQEIPDGIDTGIDEEGKKYAIRKAHIYSNIERIDAIAKFIVERLVANVYHQIRGTAKAMLAVSSIPIAITYKKKIENYFQKIVENKKYERFKDVPIYIVYSDSSDQPKSSSFNNGASEEQVLQNFKLAKNGLIIVVDKLQTGYDEPKLHTLFLDKEIKEINAIQTISRVNRTTKYKNDCKIVDFSYKNINVQNIKKAFEHFSNVVISDFAPLEDEKKLDAYYKEMIGHQLYLNNFTDFKLYSEGKLGIEDIMRVEDNFTTYVNNDKQDAFKLKNALNNYFRILNLIDFVIDLEKKYSESDFLQFWLRFSRIYNIHNKSTDLVDDVEVYFDNKIGIISPQNYEDIAKVKVKDSVSDANNTKYKYNILKVIEKRNQEEEAIANLIKAFETQIETFFEYIKTDDIGKRLVAKILDEGTTFSQDEIYTDFDKVYRKYTLLNGKNLTDFFKKETKDSLNQICDDFEKYLKVN